MNRCALSLALLLGAGAAPATAQVRIQIDIGLPEIPPLVVIQPGVQVVEGFEEEVFFHQGWYWCRRNDGWYRARSPRARFDWVEARRVPRVLVRVPEGHYRNWHHEGRAGERRREERHDMRRDDRREDREERREERREDRQGERGKERKEDRDDHSRRER